MRNRPRLTYANVMATLAFFVAIGGTTIAATKINGGKIKAGTVKGKALKEATVPGSKIKPDAIGGGQILESSLGTVPSAQRATSADSAATATSATSADIAGTLGGRSAVDLTDDCPAGTRLYAGACFESATRTAATWFTAAEICGDAGRRIPTLAELEGFRQESGVTLGSGEWSSSLQDGDGAPLDTDGFVVITMNDAGGISSANDHDEGFAPYRCVAPLSNR
jgi:hypothetical protein